MKKHITLFIFFTICITLACSIFSPKAQNQPNETVPMETTEAGQQNPSQSTATSNNANDESPITLEIYEFKEGWFNNEDLMPSGNGWKPYHVKFNISSNRGVVDLGYLGQNSGGSGFTDYPHIITTDGHTYGNTTETAFTVQVYAPPLGTFIGFPGVPLNSYINISLLSGSVIYKTVGVDFSVPEQLTPQKLVFPFLNYSIDLPPLGTEKSSEISIQTNQIVDFPGTVDVDSDINVNVSNFTKTDPYITINFEIVNNNIAENITGFSSALLVDSFGFTSDQVEDPAHPECRGNSNGGFVAGPGQTLTGTLCFFKNSTNNPSFYVLYFTTNRYPGLGNKAILIKP